MSIWQSEWIRELNSNDSNESFVLLIIIDMLTTPQIHSNTIRLIPFSHSSPRLLNPTPIQSRVIPIAICNTITNPSPRSPKTTLPVSSSPAHSQPHPISNSLPHLVITSRFPRYTSIHHKNNTLSIGVSLFIVSVVQRKNHSSSCRLLSIPPMSTISMSVATSSTR